jgi:hypothetical protein
LFLLYNMTVDKFNFHIIPFQISTG